jgi:hypothetical protein
VYNFADTRDHKKFPSRRSRLPEPIPLHDRCGGKGPARSPTTARSKPSTTSWKITTVAFLIIHRDTLKYERYFKGYDPAHVHTSFSMAKIGDEHADRLRHR